MVVMSRCTTPQNFIATPLPALREPVWCWVWCWRVCYRLLIFGNILVSYFPHLLAYLVGDLRSIKRTWVYCVFPVTNIPCHHTTLSQPACGEGVYRAAWESNTNNSYFFWVTFLSCLWDSGTLLCDCFCLFLMSAQTVFGQFLPKLIFFYLACTNMSILLNWGDFSSTGKSWSLLPLIFCTCVAAAPVILVFLF